MKNYTVIDKCRLCKSFDIKIIKKFGRISLANSFLTSETEKEKRFPLTLIRCDQCGHIQIKETVNPNLLFKNYIYRSSDSNYLKQYFSDYVEEISSCFEKNKNILEIGCNCGFLLKKCQEKNLCSSYVGVDPASNIVPKENGKNTYYYNEFFNKKTAIKLIEKHGKFSLIIANNVFAHVDQLDSIVISIKKALDKDGVFIFENAYALSTIKNLYFDQVYHEHLQYYSVKPIKQYLNKYGLEIFDVKEKKSQGGSIRCFVKHFESKKNKIKKSVSLFIKKEKDFGLYNKKCFDEFSNNLNQIQKKFKSLFLNLKKQNKTVSCYGCPAKFALFCKIFGLNKKNINYVVDDTFEKQGKFSPHSKIKIVNNKYFKDNPTDYSIITAWNVANYIMDNNKDYKGKFIIVMPDLKII